VTEYEITILRALIEMVDALDCADDVAELKARLQEIEHD